MVSIAAKQRQLIGLSVIGRPRPSFLTEELFVSVCEEVAKGKSVKRCAKEMGFCEASWRYALANDETLASRFGLAKLEQANAMEDELAEIADDKSGDTTTRILKNGEEVEVQNTEFIARSKVRIDTRKWLMSKINPRKYGDRLEVDQKVTHQVGDSVLDLFAAIRVEAERTIEAQPAQGQVIDAVIEPSEQVSEGPASGF